MNNNLQMDSLKISFNERFWSGYSDQRLREIIADDSFLDSYRNDAKKELTKRHTNDDLQR